MQKFIVLFILMAGVAVTPAMAQRAPLSPGPGQDVVETACGICHSLSYIPMNSRFMTADVWKAEVTKMRVAFGAPIDDDAANEIVAYLVVHYAAAPK
jgi:cytochrome c5